MSDDMDWLDDLYPDPKMLYPANCKWTLVGKWDFPIGAEVATGVFESYGYVNPVGMSYVVHDTDIPAEAITKLTSKHPSWPYLHFFEQPGPVGAARAIQSDFYALYAEAVEYPPPLFMTNLYEPTAILHNAHLYKLDCQTLKREPDGPGGVPEKVPQLPSDSNIPWAPIIIGGGILVVGGLVLFGRRKKRK